MCLIYTGGCVSVIGSVVTVFVSVDVTVLSSLVWTYSGVDFFSMDVYLRCVVRVDLYLCGIYQCGCVAVLCVSVDE